MAHDSPALSQSKNFNPWPFSMLDPAAPDDTSGYDSRSRSSVTLAKAGPPDSQVNNAPFCHTSCQPGLPVAATPSTLPPRVKTRTNSQLVLSTSESLATVPVVVPTRVTIAVQLNLANGSHIARSHTFREFAIRHLLIALQPRHVEAPQPAGMESNHLGYDSTAQSHQHSVAATRYPLSFLPQASLPNTHPIEYY